MIEFDFVKRTVTPEIVRLTGTPSPPRVIHTYAVMESELEVLASPFSWRRRRCIVAAIKRESVSVEDTPEARPAP